MGSSLYDILGVPQNADASEIRKAYLKLSMKHHPDKGGDPEKFKEIQKANEVLSDERRRQVYDMTGSADDGPGGGGPGGGGFPGGGFPFDMNDIFGGMFGGGMGGPRGGGVRVRRQKAPPKTHEIPLRLHDFYHGRSFQVKFDRQKFCSACKGEGATSFQSCGACQGRGIQRQVMMMGPLQMVNEGPCMQCTGSGKIPSGACYVCSGNKTIKQEKVLDVRIEPGMRVGEVLIFTNECSDDPNFEEPGDVHFILQEAAGDERWVRKEDNLATDVSINLRESLLGCNKTLQGHPGFPDGLSVEIPGGTQNLEVLSIAEKGMPKKSGGFGSLLLTVRVVVAPKEKESLEKNKPLLEAIFPKEE